jgi:hypothetical protein
VLLGRGTTLSRGRAPVGHPSDGLGRKLGQGVVSVLCSNTDGVVDDFLTFGDLARAMERSPARDPLGRSMIREASGEGAN